MVIKYNNTPDEMDSESCDINFLYYGGGGAPEKQQLWEDKLQNTLNGHGVGTQSHWYTFTEHQLIGDTKATSNKATSCINKDIIDNLNRVLMELIKHIFPT